MVLVVVDPVDGGFRGRPQGRLLSFEELVRRGLLDQTERSVTVCFGERAEGIEADLDGDGRLEVLIAGVTGEAVPAGYPADVKGYLRIVRRLPQGGYEVVWRLPLGEEGSLLQFWGLHLRCISSLSYKDDQPVGNKRVIWEVVSYQMVADSVVSVSVTPVWPPE
jgi:hypothetical protein